MIEKKAKVAMLSKQDISLTIREQCPYLAKAYGVKRIGVFGSCAKGVSHAYSDIDLVAEFERPLGLNFVEFTAYLENLFQRPVDVVLTPTGIKSIRNKRIAKAIQESILYV